MSKNEEFTTIRISKLNLRKLGVMGKGRIEDTWDDVMGRVLDELKELREQIIDMDMR